LREGVVGDELTSIRHGHFADRVSLIDD
jgi:hypothetical protein